MGLFKQIRFKLLVISSILLHTQISAQVKGVVMDKNTHQGIPFVCIYSNDNGTVKGIVSDENGRFETNFKFSSLIFSHIYYSKTVIKKENMSDTIYLSPSEVILNEIVINGGKDQWINQLLKKIVNNKSKNYESKNKHLFSYSFSTNALSDTSGYAFQSNGFFSKSSLMSKERPFINPITNLVKCKNKHAKPDFENMRRIVYDDFIDKFDKSFIRGYRFTQNLNFKPKGQTVVELMFQSKKYRDENGYILVDTTTMAIVEYEHISGSDYNIENHTSFFLRNATEKIRGFKYVDWQTRVKVKLTKIDGNYHFADCRYKLYLKSVQKNKTGIPGRFSSTESKLELKPTNDLSTKKWLVLPEPYYIIKVLSKEMHLELNALEAVRVSNESF